MTFVWLTSSDITRRRKENSDIPQEITGCKEDNSSAICFVRSGNYCEACTRKSAVPSKTLRTLKMALQRKYTTKVRRDKVLFSYYPSNVDCALSPPE